MKRASPLRAVGVRTPYADIPAQVRHRVESRLGSPVVASITQPGGMSPGCAARLRLANGGRAFVKAVGASLNPQSPDLFRAEIAVLSGSGRCPGGRDSCRLTTTATGWR